MEVGKGFRDDNFDIKNIGHLIHYQIYLRNKI